MLPRLASEERPRPAPCRARARAFASRALFHSRCKSSSFSPHPPPGSARPASAAPSPSIAAAPTVAPRAADGSGSGSGRDAADASVGGRAAHSEPDIETTAGIAIGGSSWRPSTSTSTSKRGRSRTGISHVGDAERNDERCDDALLPRATAAGDGDRAGAADGEEPPIVMLPCRPTCTSTRGAAAVPPPLLLAPLLLAPTILLSNIGRSAALLPTAPHSGGGAPANIGADATAAARCVISTLPERVSRTLLCVGARAATGGLISADSAERADSALAQLASSRYRFCCDTRSSSSASESAPESAALWSSFDSEASRRPPPHGCC